MIGQQIKSWEIGRTKISTKTIALECMCPKIIETVKVVVLVGVTWDIYWQGTPKN